MEECAFVSAAHITGRVVLAAPLRRSSPLAHPRSQQTTASELYYLKHQRLPALCCSRGKGSGRSSHAAVSRTVLVRGAGLVAKRGAALHWNRSPGPALRSHGGARWSTKRCASGNGCMKDAPHFLVLLSALAYLQGGPRTQLTCLLVLAATLTGLHVQQPFCSAMSCAAAWSVLGRVPPCPFALLPLPVLGLGPPSPRTTKRLSVTSEVRLLLGYFGMAGGFTWSEIQPSTQVVAAGAAPLDTDPGTVPHSSVSSGLDGH